MFRRLFTLLIVSTSLILGNIACGPPPVSNGVKTVTVAQWGQEKYLIYLPFYLAQEKGFFKEEGLSVSLVFSGNDDQVFASVLQGSAQFGIGDPRLLGKA